MLEQSRLYGEGEGSDGGPEGAETTAASSSAVGSTAEGPTAEETGEEGTLPFEAALARLEAVVQQLEGGRATLEESLALFEEGIRLARHCRRRLDRAEARIRVLVDGEEGDEERRLAAALAREAGGSDGEEGR